MTGAVRTLLAILLGWVFGQVPSADLAGRVSGADLRTSGTGNPGALNASHVLGRRWGAAVSVGDVGKGVLAARVGNRLAGPTGANLAATAAVAGHCFPVGRSGGKGVATSLGQVAGTFPLYLPVDIAVAVGTSALPALRQRTRVATSVASLTWVAFALVWWHRGLPNPGGVTPTVSLPFAAACSSAIVAVRFAAAVDKVEAFNATVGTNGAKPALWGPS